MSILGRLPVEIAENCEGSVASTKTKFLYFLIFSLFLTSNCHNFGTSSRRHPRRNSMLPADISKRRGLMMGTKKVGALSSRAKRVVFFIPYFEIKFFYCYKLLGGFVFELF